MTAYKTTMEEGWALVDFMANVITEAQAGTHFTTAAHALMVVGELERGWLAAHDRAVKAEALREAAADWMDTQRVPDHLLRQWLDARAHRIEKGADA